MKKFLQQQAVQNQLQNTNPSVSLGEKIESFNEKYDGYTYDQIPEMQKTISGFLADIGIEVLKIENEVKKQKAIVEARKDLSKFMEENGLVSLKDIQSLKYEEIYYGNQKKLQQLLKDSGYSETITNIEETRNALLSAVKEYSSLDPKGISTKEMDDKLKKFNQETEILNELKDDLLVQKKELIAERQVGEIIISNYLKPSEDGKTQEVDEEKIMQLYSDAVSEERTVRRDALYKIADLTMALDESDALGLYINAERVIPPSDKMIEAVKYINERLNLDCSKIEPEIEENFKKIIQTIGRGRF